MREKIKPGYHGFVPQHKPHGLKLCAYYHCPLDRLPDRRYCSEHAKEYDQEARELDPSKKVLVFAN